MAFYRNKKKLELSPRLKFGVGRGFSQSKLLKSVSVLFLIVAVGLSLNAVRLIFSGNSAQDPNSPQVLGASNVKEQTGEVKIIEYTVQEGDTLFNISQKYDINWTTLATLNDIKAPFKLKPAQVLKIPQ